MRGDIFTIPIDRELNELLAIVGQPRHPCATALQHTYPHANRHWSDLQYQGSAVHMRT